MVFKRRIAWIFLLYIVSQKWKFPPVRFFGYRRLGWVKLE